MPDHSILGQKKFVTIVKYNPLTFNGERDHFSSASLGIHHNTRITSEIRRLNISNHQTTGCRGNTGHERGPDIVFSVRGDQGSLSVPGELWEWVALRGAC